MKLFRTDRQEQLFVYIMYTAGKPHHLRFLVQDALSRILRTNRLQDLHQAILPASELVSYSDSEEQRPHAAWPRGLRATGSGLIDDRSAGANSLPPLKTRLRPMLRSALRKVELQLDKAVVEAVHGRAQGIGHSPSLLTAVYPASESTDFLSFAGRPRSSLPCGSSPEL
ncbi:hypothetical protein BKA80DRAFT_273468 [Phyllosticta citrichinensis]